MIREEDLTEREYPDFLDSAGVVLSTHFIWISPDIENTIPQGSLGWDIPAHVSDHQLKQMLRALKRINLSKATTVGTVTDTEKLRTNRDGLLEEITDSACPSCVIS